MPGAGIALGDHRHPSIVKSGVRRVCPGRTNAVVEFHSLDHLGEHAEPRSRRRRRTCPSCRSSRTCRSPGRSLWRVCRWRMVANDDSITLVVRCVQWTPGKSARVRARQAVPSDTCRRSARSVAKAARPVPWSRPSRSHGGPAWPSAGWTSADTDVARCLCIQERCARRLRLTAPTRLPSAPSPTALRIGRVSRAASITCAPTSAGGILDRQASASPPRAFTPITTSTHSRFARAPRPLWMPPQTYTQSRQGSAPRARLLVNCA